MTDSSTRTFCPRPWAHFASMPSGDVPVCTDSRHDIDMARNFLDGETINLNLNTNSIEEIVNCDLFKKVRLQMLSGEIPEECGRCFSEEACGIQSKRTVSLNEFLITLDHAKNITAEDGTIPVNIEDLELRLGNVCNLKCTTCNPSASSKWENDYNKLEEEIKFMSSYKSFNRSNYKWHKNEKYWESLKKYSDGINSVYINGGEPLIDKRHIEFLKKLNPNASIRYNTNGTIITKEVIDTWARFKSVLVHVSIDDIFERCEYLRYPAKWETLISNVQYLVDQKFINIGITQTVSIYNIFYLKEFRNYFNDIGVHPHFNFLKIPEFLAAGYLPKRSVDQILEKHHNEIYINELENYFNLFSTVSSDEKRKRISEFRLYYKKLDKIRNTSFEGTFSEWANILCDDDTF